MKFMKKSFVIIFTNYFVIISISRQISLITLNINKLNLRFIKISQYLSIFNLSIRHKIKKTNIVLNIFLYFQKDLATITKDDLEILKILYD